MSSCWSWRWCEALSPSKLLKVHYHCDDEMLVHLDIYNTVMHDTGGGFYHGLAIERKIFPKEFPECDAFECPVLPMNALMDFKLVAYLDRSR